MKRGDIVVLAPPSPFNKIRPALTVQAVLLDDLENITVALITSDLDRTSALRISIAPSAGTGLRKPSEIMIDRLQTTPISRVGALIGEAAPDVMSRVDVALRVFLGLP